MLFYCREILVKITPNSGSLMPPLVVRLHSRILPRTTWKSPDTLTLSPRPKDCTTPYRGLSCMMACGGGPLRSIKSPALRRLKKPQSRSRTSSGCVARAAACTSLTVQIQSVNSGLAASWWKRAPRCSMAVASLACL